MSRSTKYLAKGELRAVASPIRQRLLHLLAKGDELSGRMLTERLANAPSNLYYHLDVLRDAGLIEETRRENRRGAVEKYYRAVAEVFTLAPGELGRASAPEGGEVREGIHAVARGGSEVALSELEASLDAGLIGAGEGETPSINCFRVRASKHRIEAVKARMDACVRELHELAPDEGDPSVDFVFYQLLFPGCPEVS